MTSVETKPSVPSSRVAFTTTSSAAGASPGSAASSPAAIERPCVPWPVVSFSFTDPDPESAALICASV